MSTDIDQIQTQLSGLPGIRAVDMSAFPQRIMVRCDANGLRALTVERIRGMVREASGLDTEIEVELVGLPTARNRRARFESISVRPTGPGGVSARVVLEWQKQQYIGEAEGESSVAGDLRACCLATLRAVEKASGDEVSFNLVGAKELYVFDHNLVAVLVHCDQLPKHRLIGTSIIAEDRRRSAALAVLSATNRAVGNFGEGSDG